MFVFQGSPSFKPLFTLDVGGKQDTKQSSGFSQEEILAASKWKNVHQTIIAGASEYLNKPKSEIESGINSIMRAIHKKYDNSAPYSPFSLEKLSQTGQIAFDRFYSLITTDAAFSKMVADTETAISKNVPLDQESKEQRTEFLRLLMTYAITKYAEMLGFDPKDVESVHLQKGGKPGGESLFAVCTSVTCYSIKITETMKAEMMGVLQTKKSKAKELLQEDAALAVITNLIQGSDSQARKFYDGQFSSGAYDRMRSTADAMASKLHDIYKEILLSGAAQQRQIFASSERPAPNTGSAMQRAEFLRRRQEKDINDQKESDLEKGRGKFA